MAEGPLHQKQSLVNDADGHVAYTLMGGTVAYPPFE